MHCFLYYILLLLVSIAVSQMYLPHLEYYSLSLTGKDGANNIKNAPDSYSKYCGEGRFIASHDSIYGSFVFTISE